MSEESEKLYIVQKHVAEKRGLHYDFRLQYKDVLRSWAVTGNNEPPTEAGRVTMIRVEDHPIDWADFQGVIPTGDYGAGTVETWDKGTYTFRSDPSESKWSITIYGTKLMGDYSILRIREKTYYLIKKKESSTS